jgi:hypothetical protein
MSMAGNQSLKKADRGDCLGGVIAVHRLELRAQYLGDLITPICPALRRSHLGGGFQ